MYISYHHIIISSFEIDLSRAAANNLLLAIQLPSMFQDRKCAQTRNS